MTVHRRPASLLVGALLSASASGCASMTHLTKEKTLPASTAPGTTILIDAKQRAITNAMVANQLRVCAEPSPDALAAIAASGGLSVSQAEATSAAANFSLAEGAASIGLRTQSIQLMRDSMYRLCEGFVSGAIDGPAFETLHRRFQSSMVAILAIEQLTGAIKAPAVALGGHAAQGSVDAVAEMTTQTESARTALAKADKTHADALAKSSAATADREALEKEQTALEEKKDKKTATDKDEARLKELAPQIETAKAKEAELTAATGKTAQAKKDAATALENFDAARQAALAGGGSAGVKPLIVAATDPQAAADAAVAVKAIVESTLNLQFGRELCATILTKPEWKAEKTFERCLDYLTETVASIKAQTAALNELTPKFREALAGALMVIGNPDATRAQIEGAARTIEAAGAFVSQPGKGNLAQPMMQPPE